MAVVGDVTISVQELKGFLRRAWSDGWVEASVKACEVFNKGENVGADASHDRKAEDDVGRLLLEILTGTAET